MDTFLFWTVVGFLLATIFFFLLSLAVLAAKDGCEVQMRRTDGRLVEMEIARDPSPPARAERRKLEAAYKKQRASAETLRLVAFRIQMIAAVTFSIFLIAGLLKIVTIFFST